MQLQFFIVYARRIVFPKKQKKTKSKKTKTKQNKPGEVSKELFCASQNDYLSNFFKISLIFSNVRLKTIQKF